MRDGDASVLGRGEARARWLGFRLGVWLIRGAWRTLLARAGQGRSFLWGAMVAWVGGVWVAGASRLVGVTGCRARGEAGGVVRDDDDPDLGRGEARASLGGFRLVV